MKKNLLYVVASFVLSAMCSGHLFAQDDKVVSAAGDMYVISAKAGGVNYVEGKVAVVREQGKSGYLLKGDRVEVGDKVSTGADGKAEILLNPGSFARLAGNSEFEFQTTALDDLKLKLTSGSAILEVYADDEFKVTVTLPQAQVVLNRSGVFRLDVLADGRGKISVWKGRIAFDDFDLKAGRAAILDGKEASGIAKFDRDDKDEFVAWSQLRARESAKINARLQKNALGNTLLSSYNLGGWNMFNTFGLWVLDRYSGRWCFLPFGYGWSSPWGYDYGMNIWNCRLPRYVYNQPPPPMPNSPTPGNPNVSQNPSNQERGTRNRTPTFQRFENNQRGGGGGDTGAGSGSQPDDSGGINMRNNRRDTRRDDGGWIDTRREDPNATSKPVYTPPPAPPSPPIFAPSPNSTKKDN